MSDKVSNLIENKKESEVLKDSWCIRPCSAYIEEYDDCTSIKARFHQYFIHGESVDCTQWKKDYENCVKYENSNDLAAATAIIESEAERRKKRMQAHYGNNTWKKRTQPPEDWAKPLPEWFAKRNENTYLELRQMELKGEVEKEQTKQSYCVIM